MKLSFVFLMVFLPLMLCAQQSFDLDGKQTISTDNQKLFENYADVIGHGAAIFNGPEYTGGDPTIAGHQFFQSKNFQYGSVIYRGYKFDSVVMNYDIVEDKLVIVQSNQGEFVTIYPDARLVSAFLVPGHTFIRFSTLPDGLRSDGYYELLYNGPSRVVAKRRKNIGQSREKNFVSGYFETDRYFMFRDGSFHSTGSKRAVIDLFKERKKELKAFIRDNQLRFTESPETFLSRVGEFIDSAQL